MMVAGAYRGTAYSTDETRYEKNTLRGFSRPFFRKGSLLA